MRRGKSRRSLGVRSLLERLEALEHGRTSRETMDLSVSETRRIPMGYFSLGFAIACIGGGVAALMLLAVHTADAHVPGVSPTGSCSEPPTIPSYSRDAWNPAQVHAPMDRQLWWKLPLAEEKIARLD